MVYILHHVGPQWQSHGHPGEITWAPSGNHVGPQGNSFKGSPIKRYSLNSKFRN